MVLEARPSVRRCPSSATSYSEATLSALRESLRVIRVESKRMFWSQASLIVLTLFLLGLSLRYCEGSGLLGFALGCTALGMAGVTAVTHQERKNAMQAVFERTRLLLERAERLRREKEADK